LRPLIRLQKQMDAVLPRDRVIAEQNERIADAVRRERSRVRNFIRDRVGDDDEAEDILQDVFAELVEAYRLMEPIERAGAWLFRVARNRIIDRLRKKRPESLADQVAPAFGNRDASTEAEVLSWEELLPSPDAGPDAQFARRILLDELDAAIDELPADQRDVFVAHELEGRTFKELAAETGVGLNTLLSRKHYAVVYLRRRLRAIHDEFTTG